jgi:outer membrane protein TolC
LKAAEFEEKAVQYKIEDAKEMIRLQVKQLEYKVQEAAKRMLTAQKNLELAEENMRSAQEGFKEGVMKSSDVLMAQTAWLSANAEQIDAKIDYKLCAVHLNKAQGKIK